MNKKRGLKSLSWPWILATLALFGCAPGEVAPVLPGTGTNVVAVQLEDGRLTMDSSIPAGLTLFEVSNAGSEEHGFAISGQGIEAELARHLQPGEMLSLEVDLSPGTYDVFCPVEDHAEQGMRLDLTVTGQ